VKIEEKIFASLSPLVGLDAAGRKCCYPNTLPQGPTYPAIVYQLLSSAPAFAYHQAARFSNFQIQVSIHATDYDQLLTLRAQVLAAAEAMPEYVTRTSELEPPFEFEPKTCSRIVAFEFRDAEP
jgi:hypothetical protein